MDIIRVIWRRLRASRQPPAVATLPVLALTTGALYLIGGACVLLVVLLDPPPVHRLWLTLLPLSAVLSGAVTVAVGRRFPRWAFHLWVLGGNLLVTAAIMLGRGTSVVGAALPMYLFVVLDAAFFFTLAGIVAHLAHVLPVTAVVLPLLGVPWQTVMPFNGVCLGVGIVVAALSRAADEAEEDPLTRLANRRGLDRRLQEALARADEGGLFLVLIDLDGFKGVNDAGGHQRGDEILRACEDRWRPLLPRQAVLARYGGDEFALVVPDSSLRAATALAERLRTAIAPVTSASAGVAGWRPGDSASMLLHRADVALYEAKAAGRDRTVAAEPTGSEPAGSGVRRATLDAAAVD